MTINVPKKLLEYLTAQQIIDAVDDRRMEWEEIYEYESDSDEDGSRHSVFVKDDGVVGLAEYLLEMNVPSEVADEIMTEDWKSSVAELAVLINAYAEHAKPTVEQFLDRDND